MNPVDMNLGITNDSQKCCKDLATTRLDLRNAANSLQIEGKGVLPGDPYHWGVGTRNPRPYIYMFFYIHIYIYIYVCMYLYTIHCIYTKIYIYIYTFIYTHIYIYIFRFVCSY